MGNAPALHILTDDIFASMSPNRRDEIPTRPERSSPELLFHRWHPLKDFTSRDALDDLHNLCRAVHRHRLEEEVDMVLIRPDFQEHNLIALSNVQAHLFQDRVYGLAKDSSTVL